MSQNRRPPAYQEYAADVLASIEYRVMTLAQRGLFDTMRRECWVNRRLPGRHDLLAKVLSVTEQEIDDHLPAVMFHFEESDGYIFCPELEDYRKHLAELDARKKEGGRRGAAITNKKKKDAKNRSNKGDTPNPTPISSGMPTTHPNLPRRVKVGSLVESSTVEQSQNQSLEKGVISDPWLDDYDTASKEEASVNSNVWRA
jgi:hypothetical protein